MAFEYSQHYELQQQVTRARESFAISGLLTISGASGVGKTYLAEKVHQHCPQASQPFIIQDAVGLAESRMESLLFGHARGAFSGANNAYSGLVGAVGNGTLVIETIEDMGLSAQAHLLRFLQERLYRPLGAVAEQRYEGRIILSSRFALWRLKEQNLLREDFYYRIASSEIHLPSLALRPNDFAQISGDLLVRLAQVVPASKHQVSPEDIDALRKRVYPGNIHSLRNLLQQSLLCDMSPLDLPVESIVEDEARLPRSGSLKGDLSVMERRLLERALKEYNLSRVDLAAVLGISRRTLLYKLKEHNLQDDVY